MVYCTISIRSSISLPGATTSSSCPLLEYGATLKDFFTAPTETTSENKNTGMFGPLY